MTSKNLENLCRWRCGKKEIGGKFFCINYDFVACDEVDPDEIEEGEILIPMSLGELLTVL